MTAYVLSPNAAGFGQSPAGLTLTGASVQAAWSDNSDATFLNYTAGFYSYATVGLGTASLNTGAVTKTVAIYLRCALASASEPSTVMGVKLFSFDYSLGQYTVVGEGVVLIQSASVAWYGFGIYAVALGQVDIDSLVIDVYQVHSSPAGAVNVHETYVALEVAEAPTVDVTAPTGAQGTSAPTVTWTYTPGSGGGPAVLVESKIATAAEYAGWSTDALITAGVAAVHVGPVDQFAYSGPSLPLANSTTYRAYVRAAQTVNGQPQWSAWDYSQFTTSFTTANVLSVTNTAVSASGYVDVTVTRSTAGANAAWETVTIERQLGTSGIWEPVRGGTDVSTTNTFVTSWGANMVVIRDYEVPNGVAVAYMARASRTVTGQRVDGPWVVVAQAVIWSSSDYWLKNPYDPALNTKLVAIRAITPISRSRNPTVHAIEGRADPIIVEQAVLRTGSGTLVFRTLDSSGAAAFKALLEATGAVLVQLPAVDLWGSRYIGAIEPTEVRVIDNKAGSYALFWEASYVEIIAPADLT